MYSTPSLSSARTSRSEPFVIATLPDIVPARRPAITDGIKIAGLPICPRQENAAGPLRGRRRDRRLQMGLKPARQDRELKPPIGLCSAGDE